MIRFLLLCFIVAGFALPYRTKAQDSADESLRIGYKLCDWGIIVIHSGFDHLASADTRTESPSPEESQFITITEPTVDAAVRSNGFVVRGKAKGLFENNLVVEVTSADGESLFQQAVTYSSAEIGGEGDWEVDVPLDAEAGTAATIYASSRSAADGSIVAEASVSVVFDPLTITYEKLFFLGEQDRLLESSSLCTVAKTQASSIDTVSLQTNSVEVLSTRSIPPTVLAVADVELSTSCPYPFRGVAVRDGGEITIDLYIFVSKDAGCGQPHENRILFLPLGTIEETPLEITVNGFSPAS